MERISRLRKKNSPKRIIPLKHLETFKQMSKNRSASVFVYDPRIKSLINYTKGIGIKGTKDYIPSSMEVIFNIFKYLNDKSSKRNISYNLVDRKYIDPKNRFKIELIDHTRNFSSENTYSAYKLTINKNGVKKIFYIKNSIGNEPYRNAVQEMILLKFLEKKGVSIIKPRFAFSKTSLLGGIHFIVYDFTSLKNLEQSYLKKEITSEEYSKALSKITIIRNKFRFLNPIFVEDILSKNFFYKKLPNGEIKLFLIDVFSRWYFKSDISKNILEFGKKEGIVK